MRTRLTWLKKANSSAGCSLVLMAKITPCMENGKAAIAQGLVNGLGFGSTEFHVLRPTGAVEQKFIYYFIRQESYRKQAEGEMTGSVGQKRVPAEFMHRTELLLPPLAEQRRIVTKAEELLSCADSSREHLDRVPRMLKAFRQSVLGAACSGRLTEDWRITHTNVDPANKRLETLLNKRRLTWEQEECKRRQLGKRARKYKLPSTPAPDESIELPSAWVWTSVSHLARLDVGHAFRSGDFADTSVRFLRGENIQPSSFRWEDVRRRSG